MKGRVSGHQPQPPLSQHDTTARNLRFCHTACLLNGLPSISMRKDEGHGPVFFSEQSRFVVSERLQNHQVLAIANYIQKLCAKWTRSLQSSSSQPPDTTYMMMVLSKSQENMSSHLKITPQRETKSQEISQNRI